MKRCVPMVLAGMVACAGLSGCADAYSESLKYGVRTDPLVKDKKLGEKEEFPNNDPPGVLPLLSAQDLLNPRNIMKRAAFDLELLRDPTRIAKKDREIIEQTLKYLFGTPAHPTVYPGQGNSEGRRMRDDLKLDEETLERGSRLFRIHCLHCHGVPGDGRGPTARWVNPHPRDYRQGLFKFVSVNQTKGPRPPRREDLMHVLQRGIEGTAMPSFALLGSADLEDLASYVIHLSLRGKTEFDTILNAFEIDPKTGGLTLKSEEDRELKDYPFVYFELALKAWHESQTSEINVKPYPFTDWDGKGDNRAMSADLKNSILRGQKLFTGEGKKDPGPAEVSLEDAKGANCVSCHKDYGRQALYKFDEWGTIVKPRDLTQNLFRGGRRPVDIYYRIHSGISGSGMNSFGDIFKGKEERIWDLVNFVQVLPYPGMREKVGIKIN